MYDINRVQQFNILLSDICKLAGIDENITKPDILPIIAFDILQILGLISISATLCTVWFSSRIRRSNTWFSYIFSWGFSSIGCLLIIGRQTGPRPGHILCLCQTMLSNASPALFV